MSAIKEISIPRFQALVGFTRNPAASFFSQELEWYSDSEERILGILILDTEDDDFGYVILGRDEYKRFRAIDLEVSFEEADTARTRLFELMERISLTGQDIFPQGDEKGSAIDLFDLAVPEDRLNKGFVKLRNLKGFSPAKGIITEIMPHFNDIDRNFVEQFQTTGFDARIWELYLFAYLTEEELFINRTHHAPDYIVEKYGRSVCIEAVTVNPTQGEEILGTFSQRTPFPTPEKIKELSKDFMPIKWGSPLYSKLQKRYWELPHVTGKPLVLAIADFHESFAMLWSSTALGNYLYGIQHEAHINENGQLTVIPIEIKSHKIGGKEIPSAFFFQPDTENISAVLFSASATISKFNRMGKLAGFGSPDVKMIRQGTCYRHDPNATNPDLFTVEVDASGYQETWAEGLSMFHNPNAKYPVPEELFPSVAHHRLRNKQIVSHIPDFYPFSSVTFIVVPSDK